MSIKLKALGLGLLTTMALAGFMAMNATAETGGHFTSETTHTTITGLDEISGGQVEFKVSGLTGIVCDNASYSGTANATTVESLTLTPSYGACHTTGGLPGATVIDLNGCAYTLTIGKKSTTDNTVDLSCVGIYMTITHEGCEIRIPAKNNLKGVAYETAERAGKHAIIANLTVTGLEANFEAGFCILLGTSHTAELHGSVAVRGFNTEGKAVGITATGSEG
jgi:hypothetical protein